MTAKIFQMDALKHEKDQENSEPKGTILEKNLRDLVDKLFPSDEQEDVVQRNRYYLVIEDASQSELENIKRELEERLRTSQSYHDDIEKAVGVE